MGFFKSTAGAGLILLSALLACAGPAWENRYRAAVARVTPAMTRHCISTPRYRVCSDGENVVLSDVAAFMEQAGTAFERVLCLPPPSLGQAPSNVWLYTDRGRFRKVAAGLEFHASIPGFFSPVTPSAIHVRWDKTEEPFPFYLLLHEGVHQQVDTRWRIAPLRNPDNRNQGHIGIPLWLNEGLATYMESARMINDRLITGGINKGRLAELAKNLEKKKVPDLAVVLSRPYGAPFDSGDYAMAWGLVYDLKHGAGRARQPGAPDLLDFYLKALGTDLADRYRSLLKDNARTEPSVPAVSFHTWNPVMAQRSLALFNQIVVGSGRSLDEWAQDWRQRMLALNTFELAGQSRGIALNATGSQGGLTEKRHRP